VFKSLQHFEKIPVVLKSVLDCLIFSPAALEKKILKKKLAIPSESMERHIQELVSIFNTQFNPIYENCQAYHRNIFKSLLLQIDCLILKIFVSSSHSLGATAANNEQNCLLFYEVKELGLTSRTCKVGEWPC
jgi:hypothetical protein